MSERERQRLLNKTKREQDFLKKERIQKNDQIKQTSVDYEIILFKIRFFTNKQQIPAKKKERIHFIRSDFSAISMQNV